MRLSVYLTAPVSSSERLKYLLTTEKHMNILNNPLNTA